jgi:hypothetical protein
MLEQAVQNPKSHPPEVAASLLAFIQHELPVGGTSAEKRLFRMYKAVCERIFGSLDGDAATTSKGKDGSKPSYRHLEGGWLSASTSWQRGTSSGTNAPYAPGTGRPSPHNRHTTGLRSPGASSSASLSLDNDPVVQLLGTAAATSPRSTGKTNNRNNFEAAAPQQPTLLEAISKESSNRPAVGFQLPFWGLPPTLQASWLALMEASLRGGSTAVAGSSSCGTTTTHNTQRLLCDLLRRPPLEQVELLAYQASQAMRKSQTQRATPLMQLSPRGFGSAVTAPSGAFAKDGPSSKQAAHPHIICGMLEYYLFLFLRYPLAVPIVKTTTTASYVDVHRVGGSRRRETYGETLYFHLLRRYLQHFLPHGGGGSQSLEEVGAQSNTASQARDSELFLRLLISLWLESQGTVRDTAVAVQRHSGGTELNLGSSHDLVQLTHKYAPPVPQVQRGLRALVTHVLLEPALDLRDHTHNQHEPWTLPPTLTALQPSVYNYIRTTFGQASIHVADSPFYTALDVWLLWLEPWNVTTCTFAVVRCVSLYATLVSPLHFLIVIAKMKDFSPKNATQRLMGSHTSRTSRSLTIPKYNSSSRYRSSWEAYVAANLHFYTVPLAMFLRRARELDFSPPHLERSLRTVRRVFRVFSPDVVHCLNRLMSNSSMSLVLNDLIQKHVENLGPYAPPNASSLSLASCQDDMKILLEDIHMQHAKKVRELEMLGRVEAYMGSLFGSGVIVGEEKTMDILVERARLMVQLPRDYQVVAKTDARPTTELAGVYRPVMDASGKLTPESFEQVFVGTVKCNPADAVFQGNAMKSRLGNDEVAILVEFFVYLSERLHERAGIRWNLRFLANYRNLTVTLALLFVVKWIVQVWLF